MTRKVVPHVFLEAICAQCALGTSSFTVGYGGHCGFSIRTQRSQFTSPEFTSVLQTRGIAISMDGHGRWRDNVLIERLWKSVKYEDIYLKAYDSLAGTRADLARYFEFLQSAASPPGTRSVHAR